MAVTTFIPELWAGRLLRALEKSSVYGQAGVINRDYEGEISQAGDTVHIGTIGAITVKSYTRNSTIDAPETLATTDQSLLIDQEKYFNFEVDDIDKAQVAGNLMGPALQESAYALRDTVDQFVAALHTNFAGHYEKGDDTTPYVVDTSVKAYDALVDLSTGLDELNVPDEGRFCIIPPWFSALLAKDTRLMDNVPGLIGNGQIGQVDRLRVMRSNNVPNTSATKYKVIAGVPMGWSFAQQIVKTEAFRPQDTFSDAVKGLNVYGAKVIRPAIWALGTFNKA